MVFFAVGLKLNAFKASRHSFNSRLHLYTLYEMNDKRNNKRIPFCVYGDFDRTFHLFRMTMNVFPANSLNFNDCMLNHMFIYASLYFSACRTDTQTCSIPDLKCVIVKWLQTSKTDTFQSARRFAVDI